jgi:acetylornithine deacetylase/succinyl-diaminopimelate desuccinylase-like protein
LLRQLVALDTVSPLTPEAELRADEWLSQWGLTKGATEPFWYRCYDSSSIWIYSHIDTKPPGDLSQWRSPPFELSTREGRLHGLGISDAKFQLLNALRVSAAHRLNIVVDGGEECGDLSAARFLAERGVQTLVIVDGSAEAGQTYCGTMGQYDGTIVLESRLGPIHPGRQVRPYIRDALRRLLDDIAASGLHANITGISTPQTVRSLTAESCTVRFDLRFGPDSAERARHFVEKWNAILRQAYGFLGRDEPLFGARASFSSPMGSVLSDRTRVLVVPGAIPDNGNHQPNEWIYEHQIGKHEALLISAISSIVRNNVALA